MEKKKPNIVFILNDHQAYYRHGWDGGVKPLTPHFDQLGEEGVAFTNAYCATPLCGPVRRTMLNGLYAHTHKQYFNDSESPYDEESYLRLLKKAGYDNYYFGKWHAGPGTPITEHQCKGFSCEAYGNPYITDAYKQYLKKLNLPQARHRIDYNFHPEAQSEFFEKLDVGVDYQCEDTWCGEHAVGITVTPKETHEAFFLAHQACETLENIANSKSDEPFHLRVDFWGPHQPFFPTQEYLDRYNPSDIEVYGNHFDDLTDKAEVHQMDVNRVISNKDSKLIVPSPIPWEDWQQILARAYAHQTMIDDAGGMIINKLKELGLDENTIIIWTTDHGDAIASHGGHFDKCSYMSEEVMRIPMAIKWPSVIKPHQKQEKLVSNMDIPVTILDAAGLSFTNKVHGMSLLDLILDEKKSWRTGLMSETFGHGYVERIQGRMYVEGDYKYVKFEGQIDELYHLGEDPYEMNNLAQKEEYVEIKEKMLKGLLQEQKKVDDFNDLSKW
ncbi:sulfatase-like hydrolase/transferase [Vallitalea pronyensis]|uniref:Sulfatase-like hydrolase/transferase n=1 Tax=Vallitalea pronyensis TaxID=1348613 RepID=A0A8J8SFV4_9FIRM|nr:sulfatase-like hydrolase/transferase [Vallitalea pronyensis]QUI22090.1 sulfatase-like hydrolase/transferase [Vallitalea pronyensis]